MENRYINLKEEFRIRYQQQQQQHLHSTQTTNLKNDYIRRYADLYNEIYRPLKEQDCPLGVDAETQKREIIDQARNAVYRLYCRFRDGTISREDMMECIQLIRGSANTTTELEYFESRPQPGSIAVNSKYNDPEYIRDKWIPKLIKKRDELNQQYPGIFGNWYINIDDQ
ncbi:hypothetical protein DFA_06783 [Cavenderia fasciculata]|uniref:Uncharacterized protein n=1 Tax=Cavenderia fasciculata TaxID=261658 RepID=F4Q296_CACFS|nr:uncharacterized protein DFA_06783 [Cavenderia fasciculata]EGG18116.1 hypothetical protein DFA_06783 [Cavenderia fasciculata]|eukprot:XP_004366157.1 hypothetical protein DFA_06783 [Cavenderia fasciculata]